MALPKRVFVSEVGPWKYAGVEIRLSRERDKKKTPKRLAIGFAEPQYENAFIGGLGRRRKTLASKQMWCLLLACHLTSKKQNLGWDGEVSVVLRGAEAI